MTATSLSLSIALQEAFNGCLFDVQSGTLTLSTSLVNAITPATLDSCTFESIASETNGAVRRGGASCTITTGTFTSRSTTNGNGRAISADLGDLGDTGSHSITGDESVTTLTKCTADNVLGGGVYITASGRPSVANSGLEIKMLYTTFDQCSCNGQHGSNVYVECPTPRALVTRSGWSGTIINKEEYKIPFWSNSNGVEKSIISYLFGQLGDALFIGEGADTESCGALRNEPCGGIKPSTVR